MFINTCLSAPKGRLAVCFATGADLCSESLVIVAYYLTRIAHYDLARYKKISEY